ncbi:MAG: DUF1080 domain-containing protein [Bacteroidota bacterium]
MKKLLYPILLSFLLFSCKSNKSFLQTNAQDWFIGGDAKWKFEQGEIIGTVADGNGFIMSRDVHTDFLLTLEFYPDSTINSGVFIGCANREINPTDCYELNIWDLHPNQNFRTGAFVTKAPPLSYVETINKWNTYEIKMKDKHITAKINNKIVVDMETNDRNAGFYALQAANTGEIRFRKIVFQIL